MQIKAISIDTIDPFNDCAPDYGTLTVDIGGRRTTFRLDVEQVNRIASVAAEVAAEIVAEIASAEPVAA